MKTGIKRLIHTILAVTVFLTASFAAGNISAPTAYAAYENTYTNSGNQIEDIIKVAETQKGNTNGKKYNNPKGYAWCAYFIAWCARQAGINSSVIKNTGLASSYHLLGKGHYHDKGGYQPKRGDIIVYDWQNDGYDKRTPREEHGEHVGIVTGADSQYVWTIEGNRSGTVKTLKTKLTSADIKGYGTPAYKAAAPKPAEPAKPAITLSVSNISLDVTGSNSKNVTMSWANLPDGAKLDVNQSGNCFTHTRGDIQGNTTSGSVTATVVGQFRGTGKLSMVILNSNNSLLLEKQVTVNVSAPSLTVTAPSEYTMTAGTSERIDFSFSGYGIGPYVSTASFEITGTGLSALFSKEDSRIESQGAFRTCLTAIDVTATDDCTGGTVVVLLKDPNSNILYTHSIRINIEPLIANINITAPAEYAIDAGTRGTIEVTFSGQGIDRVEIDRAGSTGLTATLADVKWVAYPGICTAVIEVSAAESNSDGIVTFFLRDKNNNTIESRLISIKVNPLPEDLAVTAPSTYYVKAGASGTIDVTFSGRGIEYVSVETEGTGLSATIADTKWVAYPGICSSTVNVSTRDNFTGGAVTFRLLDETGRILNSQDITVLPDPIFAAIVGYDMRDYPALGQGSRADDMVLPDIEITAPTE